MGNWSVNLPIRYGRYQNAIANSFQRIQSLKGQKIDYLYKFKEEDFTQRMKEIGSTFKEIEMDLAEDKSDDI